MIDPFVWQLDEGVQVNEPTADDRRAVAEIPRFGARKAARELATEVEELRAELERLGALEVVELERQRDALKQQIADQRTLIETERADATAELERQRQQQLASVDAEVAAMKAEVLALTSKRDEIAKDLVVTEDLAMLQEAGIYEYRHPLSDSVAYQVQLKNIKDELKAMNRKDGGAITAATEWTVNGSAVEGRKMVRETSKLMLRAFNAEADNLVRGLKPYKVAQSIERLQRVAATIERLGKTMHIAITPNYVKWRVYELSMTADYLQKLAEEKERERAERERLREERKVNQEMERERARLDKERQHHENALAALVKKGDDEAARRVREQLAEIAKAIEDVDYRAANVRAGYVYVISNLGAFGDDVIKIGLTRRLEPMDRIRELSDASVPFNFDVHALFFAEDAVGIEGAMHERFADRRVNMVRERREFFRVTPTEAKEFLTELSGELLQFEDVPEALEYRQTLKMIEGQKADTVEQRLTP